MASSDLVLAGVALHRGVLASVRLSRRVGDVAFARDGVEASLAELRPVRTDHGVTVATHDGRLKIDLIEHLLAAVGGLGVARDLLIEPDGDELPLLDGGAARFTEAVLALGLPRLDAPSTSALCVAREASFEHGRSFYRFVPGPTREVRVEVDFPAPVGRQRAAWGGDPADFQRRIAPARTFGWARDAEDLRRAGRAFAVDLASVLVLGEDGPVPGCAFAGDDEPARHKLLDLIGDLALYGGPPRGLVEALVPGHTATHEVARRAIAERVLVQAV